MALRLPTAAAKGLLEITPSFLRQNPERVRINSRYSESEESVLSFSSSISLVSV